MSYHVMFPEAILQLQEEIKFHPELQKLLANHPSTEFEIKLAEIATYCDVILDGLYDQHDIEKISTILRDRLLIKRGGVIVVGNYS